MIQVIAAQGSRHYARGMASVVLKLAMLVALALMPFGMGGAPAFAAASAPASATAAADPADPGQCGDHHRPGKDSPMKAQLHCGACAALATIEAPAPAAGLRPELPRILRTINSPTDTEPDIATPPPRVS